MLPAFVVMLSGAVAGAAPLAGSPPPTKPADAPPAAQRTSDEADCRSQNSRNIVVCAERGQQYRIDPRVMEASGRAAVANRSAGSASPAAQAVCAGQPMGCGHGPASLDLLNVAIVTATVAVKAAKGEDWKKALTPGQVDEYQLYLEAKRKRDAQEADRAAATARIKAREAQEQAQQGGPRSP